MKVKFSRGDVALWNGAKAELGIQSTGTFIYAAIPTTPSLHLQMLPNRTIWRSVASSKVYSHPRVARNAAVVGVEAFEVEIEVHTDG
jgi:hypothetical protein